MPFFAMVALIDVSLFPYRQPVPSGLGSQVQLNVEALCQELTANIVKLEKVSRSFPEYRSNLVIPFDGHWPFLVP